VKYICTMKHLLFTLGLLTSIVSFSQTSKEILDKVSTKEKSWSTTSSDFTSTLTNPKTGKTTKQDGTIKIKGNKYQLNLPDYNVYCDGGTVWTYNKKSNACTIDNLADVKDGGFDPSEMYTIWNKDFKHDMKNANATVDGVACYEIALFPLNPKSKSFHTITLFIDKTKLELVKVNVKTRENSDISYRIKNFKVNPQISDNDFKFNQGGFPGVKMNDNRL